MEQGIELTPVGHRHFVRAARDMFPIHYHRHREDPLGTREGAVLEHIRDRERKKTERQGKEEQEQKKEKKRQNKKNNNNKKKQHKKSVSDG